MADDEVWDDDDAPSYNPVSTGNIDLGSIVARYSTNSNTGSGAAGGDGYTFDNNKENRDWGSGRPNRQNDNFGGDRGSRGPMKCYNCQEEGHNARDCPNPDSGDGRGGGGGRGRGRGGRGGGGGFGDREAGGGGGGRGSLTCFNCQEEGHTSKDCTNEKRPRAMKCYKCQEEGHVANDCTKLNKKAPCCNCGQMGHATSDCQDLPEILRNGAMQSRASVGMPTPHIPVDIDEDSLFATGVSVGVNFDAYDNIPVNVSGRDPPQKINNFDQSGLRVLLLENVKKAHYNKPTPIQSHSIPVIMRGRDLMACAQTGSGKTAAFLLPILHHILQNNLDSNAYGDSVKPACLILSPTRELSIQTYNEARKFSIGSVVKVGIVYGGTSVTHQLQRIKQGCHILVATPGRLLDYLSKSQVSFENLQFLVLDEADRMLDMGFGDNVRTVVNHPSTPPKADRRTLMFSATFSDDIQRMAKDYLNDYVFVVVGTVGAANADVKQIILEVPINERREMLVNFLKNTLEKNKNEKILVFAQEKRMADFIGIYLCQSGIQATTIHGDRYQSQREEALNEFKRGVRNVLVATAVAARGLDIEGVGYVVNFDLPKEVDEYVHRIGRTGRVGNRGCAISYFNKDVDGPIAKDLLKILREANQSVPDWLEDVADSSYPSGSFDSSHNFGARDIRRSFANPSETSAAPAFGGPACSAAADEPMWDE